MSYAKVSSVGVHVCTAGAKLLRTYFIFPSKTNVWS